MNTKVIESVDPVVGAATYKACGNDVYMFSDGYESCIQNCKSPEAARKAATRWQKKENTAVSNARCGKLTTKKHKDGLWELFIAGKKVLDVWFYTKPEAEKHIQKIKDGKAPVPPTE